MMKIKQMNYDSVTIENIENAMKRFTKLLQSEGIQRNTINEIIKNNKEEYTYARYLVTLKKLEGRSTYDR